MRRPLAAVATIMLAAMAAGAALGPTAAPAATPIISLTFDDAVDAPEPAGTVRDKDDDISWHAIHTLPPLHATYYLNSSLVGSKYGLSLSSLQQMIAAGHEVGGHTVNHLNLGHLEDLTELRRQVCGDRKALSVLPRTDGGTFDITSFAYPNGTWSWPERSVEDDHILDVVSGAAAPGPTYGGCAYSSARGTTGVQASKTCVGAVYLPTCVLRDLPTLPLDPSLRFRIPAPGSIDAANGSAHYTTLRNWVQATEQAGTTAGAARPWLVLVLHHLCPPPSTDPNAPCKDTYTLRDDDFIDLVSFLKAEQAAGRLTVRSVTEALDSTDGATTRERPLSGDSYPAVTARDAVLNGGMDLDTPIGTGAGAASDGRPDCFDTSNDDAPIAHRRLRQADGVTSWVTELTVPRGNDQRFTVRTDQGGCGVRAVVGGRYKLSVQYRVTSAGADLLGTPTDAVEATDSPVATFAWARSSVAVNGLRHYVGRFEQAIGTMPWPVRSGWRTATCVTKDIGSGVDALAPGLELHNADSAPGVASLRDPLTGDMKVLVDNVTMVRTSSPATCLR